MLNRFQNKMRHSKLQTHIYFFLWSLNNRSYITAAEEKENIKAVIRHIQKETCIVFRDVANDDEIEHSEYDKQTKNDETTTPVQENIQSESSSKETSPSNSEIGGNTTNIEHHSDEGNAPTSDNETTPKSIDAENEVKHGDDVDNKDDNIASVKENENYMRKGMRNMNWVR